MSRQFKNGFLLIFLLSIFFFQNGFAEDPNILPLRERAKIVNQWLDNRLNTVLPEIMRRDNFDMWIIICREYNEDPVYLTLVPEPVFAARRTTMLVFYDQGEKGIERVAVSRYGISNLYRGVWNPAVQITNWGNTDPKNQP